MPKDEIKVNVPEAPALLPNALKKKWKSDYADAYRDLAGDNSVDEITRVQRSLREANRTLRVRQPESYAEAKALEDWQVVSRAEAKGEIFGVTIDGKKFRFPVSQKGGSAKK